MGVSTLQFITSLFGGSGNTVVTAVLALAIVLVLILLVSWLLKFISNASGKAVRGRNKRLAVIDTLNVDQKRQLLIVRRDDVEHLILIGGTQDIVVEAGFSAPEHPVAVPSRRGLSPSAGRRMPPPAQPTTPTDVAHTDSPEPVVTAAPGTVLEQLQRAGHPSDRKGHVSLRHTGLLRPVRKGDEDSASQTSDYSTVKPVDSDKEGADTDLGGNASLDNDTKKDANRS
ncbi:flagellar biosynthetic protein FliO [Devosia sp. MC532]|nr:flagellar biosynthetic protein FliO [Devosia sp. MC532]